MAWQKARIWVGNTTLLYYSGIPIELNDNVVVETKYGPVKGRVVKIEDVINCNPFKPNSIGCKATCHVWENATKKVYDKENKIMFGCKTVEVLHSSSNHRGIFYTDLILHNGDLVVYEGKNEIGKVSMHVGTVINDDPDVVTAESYIVDAIDVSHHNERKNRLKEANKLRAKLNAKRKQFQDIELLRLIAASDDETKDMLDAYTKLIGVPQEVK